MVTTRSGSKKAPAARKTVAKAPAARKTVAKKAPAARKTVAKTQAQKNAAAAAKKALNPVKLYDTTGASVVLPGHVVKVAKARAVRHTAAGKSIAPKGHITLYSANKVAHHVPRGHHATAKAKNPLAKTRALHGDCAPTTAGTPRVKTTVMVNGVQKKLCRTVKGTHGRGHSKIVGGAAKGKTYNTATRVSQYTKMGFPKGAVGSRGNVLSGRAHHTVGGLTAADFIKTPSGKYVSKKASLAAQKRFADPSFSHVRNAFATTRLARQGAPRKSTTSMIRDASTTELIDVVWAFTDKKKPKATEYAGKIVRNSQGVTKRGGTRWTPYKG